MGVMFITHDMGVVAEIADDVLVMYQGKVMESGPVETIFHAPQDAYTRMLIGSVLKLEEKAEIRRKRPPLAADGRPVIEVEQSRRCISAAPAVGEGGRRRVDQGQAPRDARHRRRVAARARRRWAAACCASSIRPRGAIDYRRPDGSVVDLATADKATLKTCRREIRMIFQDPVSSLNPRMTVAQIIGEPLLVNGIAKGAELDDRVAELMRQVGLEPCLARALSARLFRRPASAHRHRARDRARAAPDRGRRSRPRRSTCRCVRRCSTC